MEKLPDPPHHLWWKQICPSNVSRPMDSKTALCDPDKVDPTELACRNLIHPRSSVQPAGRLPVPTSVTIFGNKFKEKTLLQARCFVIYEVIYFKMLQYKQDGIYVKPCLSTLQRWLALKEL